MGQDSVEIKNVQGDVIGASISGSGHIVGKEITINGNIIQLVNPSPEAIERLGKVASIPTELRPNQSAEMEGSPSRQEFQRMQKSLDEVLNLVKGLEQQGQRAEEIHAGALNLSRVDLLLKKAVLLKTEADQMYFDQIERNKSKIEQAKAQSKGSTFQLDMNAILAGFDDAAHEAKLQEALGFLQEVNQLAPSNTEALLHLAQVQRQLSDDPHEERKILYRVLNLLNAPKDDTEKFRKAQATFLLATSGEDTHVDMLRDARAMFEQLGRTSWVRQCDDLLASIERRTTAGQQASYGAPLTPTMAPPAVFQPAGQWRIQVSDGSLIVANFYPNGALQGWQQSGFLTAQFAGQWAFIPQAQMLQLQGLINGFQPFMLAITMQGMQNNGYYGVGNDGHGYFFTRA